jgi:hypothetical protein
VIIALPCGRRAQTLAPVVLAREVKGGHMCPMALKKALGLALALLQRSNVTRQLAVLHKRLGTSNGVPVPSQTLHVEGIRYQYLLTAPVAIDPAPVILRRGSYNIADTSSSLQTSSLVILLSCAGTPPYTSLGRPQHTAAMAAVAIAQAAGPWAARDDEFAHLKIAEAARRRARTDKRVREMQAFGTGGAATPPATVQQPVGAGLRLRPGGGTPAQYGAVTPVKPNPVGSYTRVDYSTSIDDESETPKRRACCSCVIG